MDLNKAKQGRQTSKQGKQSDKNFNGLEWTAITLHLHPFNYIHNISRNTTTKIFV
jgi:hypothetical protein